MEEERYSVVAAYKNNEKLWFYRLADIDPIDGTLEEAIYNTDDNEFQYEPVTIYSKEPKELYKAILKKWTSDSLDDQFQHIHPLDIKGKVYEMAYLEDNIENVEFNEEYIRQKLKKGFIIDKAVNKEFLLIVGEQDNSFISLLCDKSKFVITPYSENNNYEVLTLPQHDRDISHNLNILEMYKLKTNSIVAINNLLEHHYSRNINIRNRYFYEYLKLPKKSKDFLVREIDDYSLSIFSKYFKEMKDVYKLTNKERNNIISMLDSILKSDSLLKDLEKQTGYITSDLNVLIEKDVKLFINVLNNEDEVGKILLPLLINNKGYHDLCLDIVKTEWENSTEYEQKQAEYDSKINELLQEIQDLETECSLAQEQHKKINDKNCELLEKNRQLIKENGHIENSTKQMLQQYRNDIASIIKDSVILENVSGNKADQDSGFFLEKSDKTINEIFELESNEDCENQLFDNFKTMYSAEKCSDLTASILSAIQLCKSIIVDDCLAEDFSDILASVFDGKKADKYYVYNTNVNIYELCNSILKSQNSIIYLGGILNSYNENAFSILCKMCKKKVLIFGVNEEIIKSLSVSIWKQAVYIDITSDIECSDSQIGYSTYSVERIINNSMKVTNNGKADRNLKKISRLNSYQNSYLASLLDLYLKINSQSLLPIFYLNQVALNICREDDSALIELKNIYSLDNLKNTLFAKEFEDAE